MLKFRFHEFINSYLKSRSDVSPEHKKRELKQNRILLAELEKYVKTFQKKERRHRLEIYSDILRVIGGGNGKELRPTKIQLTVKTSYDKLVKYLDELEENKLIYKKPFSITERGRQFLSDYAKIIQYIPKSAI